MGKVEIVVQLEYQAVQTSYSFGFRYFCEKFEEERALSLESDVKLVDFCSHGFLSHVFNCITELIRCTKEFQDFGSQNIGFLTTSAMDSPDKHLHGFLALDYKKITKTLFCTINDAETFHTKSTHRYQRQADTVMPHE